MKFQSVFLELFEKRLESLLLAGVEDAKFKEALLYQFYPAGKRLRPLLMAAYAQDILGTTDPILDLACALELLHTASLIHDDLPALDNDIERRGRPTLHVQVGQGTALLVGDYLIARAFSICSEAAINNPASSNRISAVLAKTFCNLCFGQELDIRNSASEVVGSLELYDLKTGALFHAAFEIVRLICFDQNQIKVETENFATSFGRAFQVLNDFTDVQSEISDIVTARTSNSDARNQRTTALSLLSTQEHGEFVKTLYNQCWSNLEILEKNYADSRGSSVSKFGHLRELLQFVF